ncbi:hypothetical protein GCM10017608_00430 [Agromyces luteolus]|uniref:DUF4386 family protein n=1 Tax=Agromyces luteolus TaxID=88373 RepID=A0A7C9LC22_9MICO|nr:DUF4386 domain-containing protein [Agromyces luteolus]MUN05571.1 DUF4386 family protein [Agromyces luteolus]GLK26111.1 hypothetical protein GCM10017608_00430 [Agromyces luteolus]
MRRAHETSGSGSGTRTVRPRSTPERRAATTAGALVLVAMIAGVLSVVPVLEEPDYLGSVTQRGPELVSGALFQLVMVVAYAGFALVLHPILRRASPTLGVGFVGFRLVACGFHLLAIAMLALLLDLAHGYDAAIGTPAAEVTAIVAEAVRIGRDLVNHVVVITAMGLGDLLLFVLLLRWRLVPRWLSVWGIAGVVAAIAASALLLAGVVEVVGVPYLALTAPLALQGVVLAGLLVVRGLDTARLPA